MNIAWFTVRQWADLCATTTDALAHGMVRNGHALTVFNHDAAAEHEEAPWQHVHLERSERRGFQARSLGKSAARWLADEPRSGEIDVALVDWPLLPVMMPALARLNRPVVLIDRSPQRTQDCSASFNGRPGAGHGSACATAEFKPQRLFPTRMPTLSPSE